MTNTPERRPKGFSLKDFVRESNRIEGISHEPTSAEIEATRYFIGLKTITVEDLIDLVAVYAPGHRLRDKIGLNAYVGIYIAPAGGPKIRVKLKELLSEGYWTPWDMHIAYESLHPFTDGNGRSGRALWLWQMGSAPIGFLHKFYYQTLQSSQDGVARRHEALFERTKEALGNLHREVNACWGLTDALFRRQFGNTNYQCVVDRLEEARAALAAIKAGE